ncbi:MAG: cation transporter [Actinobacteria bacterium]|jgi:hypothetical protein|nr:cation transporter [Micrococcales bacterium]MCB0904328.1 cation transporter [Actinomycetota bacterium]HRV66017.1 hypothetical protein [Candidatus Nanopelagicales bacterium]MCB9427940.1 cation transporter [Actinomycetota bacterium]HPE12128.1 hypothetical protein [Actinomycetota bacterium]
MPTETDAALRREQRLLVTSTATAAGFAAVGIVWGWWSQSQIILLDGMYALIGLGLGLLSLRAARLVEAGPTPKYPFDLAADLPPQEVEVPGMPTDAASHAGKSSLGDRSHSGRLVGSEGKKILVRQYARAVDDALRPLLRGDERPLILIAPQPINAIFRSVCSYPYLLDADLQSSGDRMTETEIAEAVQPLLADAEEQRRAQLAELLDQRRSQNRVLEDLADIARAATAGAVDTLIVDRAANESGSLDEAGNLTLDDSGINVVDEVAGRVLTTGGTVLALPDAKTSAILRYAL